VPPQGLLARRDARRPRSRKDSAATAEVAFERVDAPFRCESTLASHPAAWEWARGSMRTPDYAPPARDCPTRCCRVERHAGTTIRADAVFDPTLIARARWRAAPTPTFSPRWGDALPCQPWPVPPRVTPLGRGGQRLPISRFRDHTPMPCVDEHPGGRSWRRLWISTPREAAGQLGEHRGSRGIWQRQSRC